MTPEQTLDWLAAQPQRQPLTVQPVQPADGNRTSVDSGALKLALNVLRRSGKDETADALHETAIREPIAQTVQPAQEPAVKAFEYVNTAAAVRFTKPEYINGVQHPVGTLFYTSPPQREWVGLTDDEMHQCFDVSGRREPVYRALEAALKEKNT